MTHQQLTSIGNPVDAWWNTSRHEIAICIDLLGQFPPAPNSPSALEILPAVRRAHEYIKCAYYPHQAEKVRKYLLDCLYELVQSLKEQAAHGLMTPKTSHNMAYYSFMRVTHLLMQRGIYEPEPIASSRSKVS